MLSTDTRIMTVCPHGTTAHPLTLEMEAGAFVRWLRGRAAAHRAVQGCRCTGRQIGVTGPVTAGKETRDEPH